MSIEITKQGNRYIALVTYNTRHIAKNAGFRWCAKQKHWYTTDPVIAERINRGRLHQNKRT